MNGKRARANRHIPPGWVKGPYDAIVDTASERDRVYFEPHPEAEVYVRRRISGEFGERDGEAEIQATTHVQVTQMRPGCRTRKPGAVLLRSDYRSGTIPLEHAEAFVARLCNEPFFFSDEQLVEEEANLAPKVVRGSVEERKDEL